MKKILLIAIVPIILILCVLFKIFMSNDYNFKKSGNNINTDSKILEIKSFEAEVEVTVVSNKNTNKYVLKQKYVSPNLSSQEVVEPSNISGIKFIYDGKDLKIENTKLNLSKIYGDYMYVGENILMLSKFIEEYTSSKDSSMEEAESEIIYKTVVIGANKYTIHKNLYVNKSTRLPYKLEIQDINQNTTVYILYNEIKINSLNEKDVLI